MTIAFIRTLLLYAVVILALRLMGKRQIGELSPSELVVTILISDLAAIPMQDPGISILNGIIPIATLLALEILISSLLLKSRVARKVLVGSSSILIDNGKVNQKEIRRMRITMDELVEELRLKGFPDITCVKYAILETNGKISTIPFSQEDGAKSEIPVTIISDGKLNRSGLAEVEKDELWLKRELSSYGISNSKDILLMQYIEKNRKTIIISKNNN